MRCYGLILLFILPFSLLAQQNQFNNPVAEIQLESLDLVSFDTKDQLFVSSTSGDIYQFDRSGKRINLYSPERQGRLNQLEAAWTVNIFSFSSDLQEYRILDRFLNPLAENGFLLADINLAKAASLGNNNIVWVWDESDLSLKSLDYLRNTIVQSQPLNLILSSDDLEVLEIREFKNRLFMNIPNEGIYIFDNQGNLIKKIAVKGILKLCYFNEHLLWVDGSSLMAISISTQEILNLARLDNSEVTYLQISQDRVALVRNSKVLLYETPIWLKTLR